MLPLVLIVTLLPETALDQLPFHGFRSTGSLLFPTFILRSNLGFSLPLLPFSTVTSPLLPDPLPFNILLVSRL